MAASFVFVVFILAMTGHSSATWCICKDGLSDSVLQKTLDYACGSGADCNPIHQTGVCYNPNTVRAHCSYAVNSYFQKKGQSGGTCDFSGTATPTATDPSLSGCAYPSSLSSAGTGTTPVSTTPPGTTTPPGITTPSTTTPSTTTPTTTSPYTTTPSTGGLGGVGTGLGPSGINTDVSRGGLMLIESTSLFSSFLIALLGVVFVWV